MLLISFSILLMGFLASLGIIKVLVNRVLCSRFSLEEQWLPQLSWGWLIYFLIFKFARWRALSIEPVRLTYLTISLTSLGFIGFWLCRNYFSRKRQLFTPETIEWLKSFFPYLAVFAVMASLDIYLEFPSDPLVHLQHIQAWEKVALMDFGSGRTYSRFIYFFQNWLFRYSDLSMGTRTGMLLFGATLQTMLFWQFVRLTKLLTHNVILGWFGGLMSLAYFGYDAFSFYRYTTFGGATVAYICCLEGFILIVAAFFKEEIKYLLLLPPILFFCYGNHEQEALLQLNAIVGISFLMLLFRRQHFTKKMLRLMSTIAAFTFIFTIYTLFAKDPLGHNIDVLNDFNLTVLLNLDGRYAVIHDPAVLNLMTGFLGWFSAIAAAIVLIMNRQSRQLDIAAAITVWPWIVLLNPIGIEVLERYMSSQVFHRLIYGSMYWLFPLVAFPTAWEVLKRHSILLEKPEQRPLKFFLSKERVTYLLAAILVTLAFIHEAPVRGKMSHIFYRPPAHLDGRNLREPIRYLRQSAQDDCFIVQNDNSQSLPILSWVLSDPYTSAYLSGTGYFYTAANRFGAPGFESIYIPMNTSVTQQDINYESFIATLKQHNICYIVIYIPQKSVHSKTGLWVGHWSVDYADTRKFYSSDFIDWVSNNPQDFDLVYKNQETTIFKVQ